MNTTLLQSPWLHLTSGENPVEQKTTKTTTTTTKTFFFLWKCTWISSTVACIMCKLNILTEHSHFLSFRIQNCIDICVRVCSVLYNLSPLIQYTQGPAYEGASLLAGVHTACNMHAKKTSLTVACLSLGVQKWGKARGVIANFRWV